MNKHNFIGITLVISGLTFNPAMATQIPYVAAQSQTNITTVSSSIATILHKRGIDEEVAHELTGKLLEEDEELLALMIQNLEEGCNSVSREEILEHLSTIALHRQNVHFDSYDHLVGMVSKIKQKALDENTLMQLHSIAKTNSLLLT